MIIELSKIITEEYRIVIVGLDKRHIKRLPSNIIGIERTDSIIKLAEIYSSADVLISASIEETFGLTVIEAFACGTPAVVYNSTALPELCTESTGIIVEPHDIDGLWNAIVDIPKLCSSTEELLNRASLYDRGIQFQNYISLYQSILNQKETEL